jgi:hypothetical protein
VVKSSGADDIGKNCFKGYCMRFGGRVPAWEGCSSDLTSMVFGEIEVGAGAAPCPPSMKSAQPGSEVSQDF